MEKIDFYRERAGWFGGTAISAVKLATERANATHCHLDNCTKCGGQLTNGDSMGEFAVKTARTAGHFGLLALNHQVIYEVVEFTPPDGYQFGI